MPVPRSVTLNALFLAPGLSGGPETYLRGLVPALAREFPALALTVVTTRTGATALRGDGWGDFATVLALPCEDGQRIRRQLAEQVLLPGQARWRGAEIVHSLASVAPVHAGAAAVITLHDVTFMVQPTFGRVTTLGMQQIVAAAARRADALITATAASRDEICGRLGLEPAAFFLVPHGMTAHGPSAPLNVVRARYRLGGSRVVLCVGAKRPHKNQQVLVRAAAELDRDVVIVLAGHPEPYDAKLRALAAELGTNERLRFVDYVPNAELEALWRIADCMAIPTLAEGFGIPVLEALSRGVPVAASDIPVLREVGGGLPHYFDPHLPAAAAAAIRAALADTCISAHGPAHTAQFTWEAAAHRTFQAYEHALLASHR